MTTTIRCPHVVLSAFEESAYVGHIVSRHRTEAAANAMVTRLRAARKRLYHHGDSLLPLIVREVVIEVAVGDLILPADVASPSKMRKAKK
jgi:hypothetical protein